jgi:hypothetical protein
MGNFQVKGTIKNPNRSSPWNLELEPAAPGIVRLNIVRGEELIASVEVIAGDLVKAARTLRTAVDPEEC